jgi:putative NADH-flavin reductase
MKIAIFGGTGNVGSRIVEEAVRRGHDVKVVARDESRFKSLPAAVDARVGDVSDVSEVASFSDGQDLVISAIRPPKGHERLLVAATKSILAGLSETRVRLLISGGAGSLLVPDTEDRLVADDPEFVSTSFKDIALACVEQYHVCMAEKNVDWTYLCPAAQLVPGERTGNYRKGKDRLVVDANGMSLISMEDLAVAVLDEAETPQHSRERFTVAYG